MRTGKLRLGAAVTVFLIVPGLMAQVVAGVGIAASGGLTGEPYTAVAKTTHIQTLADGNKITRKTSVREARDSAGRTYRETRPDLPGDLGGITTVVVHDPVNRVQIIWNTRAKVANIIHLPDPEQIRARAAEAPNPPPLPTPPTPQATPGPKAEVEHLGFQTVNGVMAEGTRTTRTIPAGRQGNEQPIVITNEVWISRDLRLVVRSLNNDPRTGATTMDLTDIQQGEPDPALFQAPEGYTVKEQFPPQPNQE